MSGAENGGALVEASAVSVRIGGNAVLDGVDLTVAPGEIVTLIGPNGSGKTTLVRAVLGLLSPDEGNIRRREDIRIGYVPQHIQIDATLPLTVRRFLALAGPRDGAAIAGALDEVGAGHLFDRPVHALSGGEIRRVLLARAVMRRPDLLVLDEPSAGVDMPGQAELYALIVDIRDRHGCGVLLVSHNLHMVMAATDEVICLNHHVCCHGRPEAVSRHPEYLSLFGTAAAGALAVYTHHHDHRHDISGEPMEAPAGEDEAYDG